MAFSCNDTECKYKKTLKILESQIVPYEIFNKKLKQVFSYFQYRAPGVSSPHACRIHDDSKEMVYKDFITKRKIISVKFCTEIKELNSYFEKYYLLGNEVCYKCKRFVCKKNKKESDFDCLIRHLRNSIAHGRVSLLQQRGSFLYFEDRDKAGITAKIILNLEDLVYLRKIIYKDSIK